MEQLIVRICENITLARMEQRTTPSREMALVITKLEEALMWLQKAQ